MEDTGEFCPKSTRTTQVLSATPLAARAVIVATGGLSIPKSGRDGLGLSILEGLGHTIRAAYPALTPLMTAPESPFTELAGLSLPLTITARSTTESASSSSKKTELPALGTAAPARKRPGLSSG